MPSVKYSGIVLPRSLIKKKIDKKSIVQHGATWLTWFSWYTKPLPLIILKKSKKIFNSGQNWVQMINYGHEKRGTAKYIPPWLKRYLLLQTILFFSDAPSCSTHQKTIDGLQRWSYKVLQVRNLINLVIKLKILDPSMESMAWSKWSKMKYEEERKNRWYLKTNLSDTAMPLRFISEYQRWGLT